MLKFTLTYELSGSGWATACLANEVKEIEVVASSLHDSLLELTEAAAALHSGVREQRVVFLDEPGEVQLHLHRNEGDLAYEARWYDTWNSKGIGPESTGEVLLVGRTTVKLFACQVYSTLESLLSEYGQDAYKKQWVKHDFPIESMKSLKHIITSKE